MLLQKSYFVEIRPLSLLKRVARYRFNAEDSTLENNLSETAFVKIIDSENYEIRWFIPTVEVDFLWACHACQRFCII